MRLVGFYQLEQVISVVWGLHSPWERDADHVVYPNPGGLLAVVLI